MKKLLCVILVSTLIFCCLPTSGATASRGDSATPPETTADAAVVKNLSFDVEVDEPEMPWPVQRLSYQIYIDYPVRFETTDTTDDLMSKPINWTPVEPIELYQLSDGSWSSTIPSDIPASELRSSQFYLIEPDRYYRIIANYGNRTQNIGKPYLCGTASYSLSDVYSGMLKPGRTGLIALELTEQVNDVSIIHRCRLNLASVKGASFTPKAYASNINGDIIITYYPTTSTDRRDYYTNTNIGLITPTHAFPMPIFNLLY